MLDKVRVTKSFTFDMAHALFGYDGPCKNIHGHTYHLFVTLMGNVIQPANSAEQGLVIDFGEIKEIVKTHVVDHFDHALVLNQQAQYATQGFLSEHFEKVIRLPFQPSCENLFLFFKNIIREKIPQNVKLVRVKLTETPTSFAEWRLEDNI